MATLKLNIYSEEKKSDVEKTYTAEGYDLMLGTTEDLMQIIDLDNADDNIAIAKMVIKGYKQIAPLLKDIFPGLTDDELRRVKFNELIPLAKNLITDIVESIKLMNEGN